MSRRHALLAAVGLGGCTLLLAWPDAGDSIALARLVTALLVGGAMTTAFQRPLLLLSPLLWIGLIIPVAFVAIPPVFVALEHARPHMLALHPFIVDQVEAYVGSRAEATLLAAAMGLLGLFSLCQAVPLRGREAPTASQPVIAVTAALAIGGALVHAFGRSFVPADVTLPLMALAVAVLAHGSRMILAAVLLVLVAATLPHGEMKLTVALIALPALASLASPGRLGRRRPWVWLAVVATCAVPIAVMLPKGYLTVEMIVRNKLLMRQSETAHCYDRVIERHWENGGDGRLANLFIAVVPRVVWPDKPKLSNGVHYATEYCGRSVNPDDPLSASLTVFGEPVREAGRAGFVTALILTGVGAVFTTLAVRRGGWGIIAGLALWPWMIDVDQNFAMYLGRLVKAVVVMAVAAVSIAAVVRGWSRRQANPSSCEINVKSESQ